MLGRSQRNGQEIGVMATKYMLFRGQDTSVPGDAGRNPNPGACAPAGNGRKLRTMIGIYEETP